MLGALPEPVVGKGVKGKDFLKALELEWVLQARSAMILVHCLALLNQPCKMAQAASNELYGLFEFSGL